MGKKIKINEQTEKSFRVYRRFTLNFVFIAICISIWSTMMTQLTWSFKDIIFEVIALLVIIVCGMFGNVKNRFSLFHIRSIRITRERLISILLGISLPISFIIYFMVSDSKFMDYIKTITLHDFITLSVLLIPLMIVIALIIYFSYVVLELKYSREKLGEYAEKTEKSLDEHKMVCLTFVCLIAIASIWVKLSYNYDWQFNDIKTEVIILIILMLMKIISNVKNKLPWNYSSRLGYSKYIYIFLCVPYLIFGLFCIFSPSLRNKIMDIGIPKTVSLIALYSPLIGLTAVIVSCLNRIIDKLTTHSKNNRVKQTDKIIKKENIVISLILSLLSVMLIFIYIITSVLTSVDMNLLIKTICMLIPVGILMYTAIYYSVITINK